ncbi:MAG: hypothetical protein KQH63_09990 [Desulfobulbaceae bacterium]|nr:hypothetical protein [Desulfobulbaceae bacterium]
MKHLTLLFVAFVFFSTSASAEALASLISQIEQLQITRQGYTLGAVLTDAQKKIASEHKVQAASPGTMKFKDGNLFVVTDEKSDRVIVLYEHHDAATRKEVQEMVGDLFFVFDSPTVMAHNRTIYWAYGEDGKISEEQFEEAKKDASAFKVLATVKLDSTLPITTSDKEEKPESSDKPPYVYYIISSEAVLKALNL